MTIDTMINSILKEYDYMSCYNGTKRKLNTYTLVQEDNNLIFKCLATGLSENDIKISFDDKKLYIKSLNIQEEKDFGTSFNDAVYLSKRIDPKESYAKLSKGILTIKMPLLSKEGKQEISFK